MAKIVTSIDKGLCCVMDVSVSLSSMSKIAPGHHLKLHACSACRKIDASCTVLSMKTKVYHKILHKINESARLIIEHCSPCDVSVTGVKPYTHNSLCLYTMSFQVTHLVQIIFTQLHQQSDNRPFHRAWH